MLRQIKPVIVPTGSTKDLFFISLDGVHAHSTWTHMHAHAHMQTFDLLLSWQRLWLTLASTCWSHTTQFFFFLSQCKRQQSAGHLINTNKLLSVWKSVYARMCSWTIIKKNKKSSLIFHNVSFSSYKSDYTINIHHTFICLTPADFCKT